MTLQAAAGLLSRAFEKLVPSHLPPFLVSKPDTIRSYLSFEGALEGDHETILMNDGAIGRMWEISLIAHETLSEFELTTRLSKLSEVFSNARNKLASFQIIFEATPSAEFETPDWASNPQSIAQKIQTKRIEAIKAQSQNPNAALRTMKRAVYICLRLEDETKLGLASKYPSTLKDSVNTTEKILSHSFKKLVREIENLSQSIEQAFSRNQIEFKRSNVQKIRDVTQDALHGFEFQRTSNLARELPES